MRTIIAIVVLWLVVAATTVPAQGTYLYVEGAGIAQLLKGLLLA